MTYRAEASTPPLVPRSWPGPLAPFLCVRKHGNLVWQLSRQEVLRRYRGSVLGIFWSFVKPAVLLAVFTFVFSVIFEARWNRSVEDRAEFALVMFAGFIVFWLFSECLNRAPMLILSNVNYVKKVVFPLEILPWTVMLAALLHAGVSALVLILVQLVAYGRLHLTVLLYPFLLLPLVALTMGITWFLASLAVYYRDVQHAIGVVLILVMYTSAIFYPPTAVPEDLRILLYLNPITYIVAESRELLLWGNMPDWVALLRYSLVAYGTAWLGFAWFQKTKKGFANVI